MTIPFPSKKNIVQVSMQIFIWCVFAKPWFHPQINYSSWFQPKKQILSLTQFFTIKKLQQIPISPICSTVKKNGTNHWLQNPPTTTSSHSTANFGASRILLFWFLIRCAWPMTHDPTEGWKKNGWLNEKFIVITMKVIWILLMVGAQKI